MMKLVKIVFLVLIAAFSGCKEANLRFGGGSKVLAKVGGKELLMDDVKGIFTYGIAEQDSVKLLESYVDVWVRQQVKINEAETKFSADQSDIERLVDDYRGSLLSNKLDQFWINSGLESDISEAEVRDYYDNHMFDFLLDRPVIKGSIAVIPADFSGRQRLFGMMGGSSSERKDFSAIVAKNNFELHEYDSWTDASVFFSRLSSPEHKDFTFLLSTNGVVEITDRNTIYLVFIAEKRNQGDVSPLERVSDLIVRTLYNQRKGDVIRAKEDSLVMVAKKKKKLEININ